VTCWVPSPRCHERRICTEAASAAGLQAPAAAALPLRLLAFAAAAQAEVTGAWSWDAALVAGVGGG